MADWESDPVVSGNDWQSDPVIGTQQSDELPWYSKLGTAVEHTVEPIIQHPVHALTGMFTDWSDVANLPENVQKDYANLQARFQGQEAPYPENVRPPTGSQEWYDTLVGNTLPMIAPEIAGRAFGAMLPKEAPRVSAEGLEPISPSDIVAPTFESDPIVASPREIHTSPETGFQFYKDTGEPVLPPEQQGATVQREFAPEQEPRPADTAVGEPAGQQQAAPEPAASVEAAQAPDTGVIPPEDARYAGISSTKNAATDAAREEVGLPPRIEQAAAEDFGQETWDASAERLREDPGAGQRLADDINSGKVRAIDADDNALLLREQIKARIEHSNAVDAKNAADLSGDPNAIDSAGARLDQARDNYQNILDASAKAGTELSHGFSARKIMANEDYSLARMEASARAAKGKPLNGAELSKVAELQKRIETLEQQANQRAAGMSRPMAARRAIRSDALDAMRKGKSLGDFLSEKADAARARIEQMKAEAINCV